VQPSVDSVTTFGPAWIGRPIVELTDLTYFGRPARLVWQTPVVGPVTGGWEADAGQALSTLTRSCGSPARRRFGLPVGHRSAPTGEGRLYVTSVIDIGSRGLKCYRAPGRVSGTAVSTDKNPTQ